MVLHDSVALHVLHILRKELAKERFLICTDSQSVITALATNKPKTIAFCSLRGKTDLIVRKEPVNHLEHRNKWRAVGGR